MSIAGPCSRDILRQVPPAGQQTTPAATIGPALTHARAPRHACHSLAVVRVTDSTMTAASWNWDHNRWAWTHTKRINAAEGR